MNYDNEFWESLNKLVKENDIVIDRPKGTKHPKYDHIVYELDYGYISDTTTTDGKEIDVFKGSLHNTNVSTILCTIDLLKKDIEIKVLIGCTIPEKEKVYNFLNNSEYMKAIIIEKDVPIDNYEKKICLLPKDHVFNEIHEVFQDVVFDPSEENIKKIVSQYTEADHAEKDQKILYGYFINKKLVGIIGIKRNTDNIDILHFGIHPEYRGKKLGTELMDFIKKEKMTMKLTTDDDAVVFYRKYGFTCDEYFEEKYQRKRYNCVYVQ